MKDTFITGAHGFIGSHLTEKLDSFTSIAHQDIDQIHLPGIKRFFFLSTYGNLAEHNASDNYEILKANVVDLVNILKQINFENGLTSFVYISTSSVNLKIQTPYSRAKRAAEEILLTYMERYNAPISIIRPFSVTGVGEQKTHLIPTLIRSCLIGEEMPFVPNAVHDYVDVDDIVDGMLTLSRQHAKGIFELGTGKGISNQEVLNIVESITGKKANIHIVKNLRSYDNLDWVSRNFSSRNYGWTPKKTLKESVTEMVEKFKSETNKYSDRGI